VLSKVIKIILRQFNKKDSTNKSLARVIYNLIQLSTIYNNKKWVSHFYCYFTDMDFIYIHAKKSQSINIITEFLNIMRT